MVDSREQLPYEFKRFSDQFETTLRRKLLAGDYSVEGYDTKIAFERKSLQDLVQTVIHGRSRFKIELAKLSQYEHKAIVVEASMSQVLSPYSFSNANPRSVFGSLQSFALGYGVQVIFADNRANAELWIAESLLKFYKYANAETP